jgi:hypothetical protein
VRFDLKSVTKLIHQAASYNFLACKNRNALIRGEAEYPLEVMRELNLSIKASSDLSQNQRAAKQDAADHLAESSLLGRK